MTDEPIDLTLEPVKPLFEALLAAWDPMHPPLRLQVQALTAALASALFALGERDPAKVKALAEVARSSLDVCLTGLLNEGGNPL